MTLVFLFALLAPCYAQTISPTPAPCSAPPGSFCSGGATLLCPIGAYCAGGAALNVSCYPVTACAVAGLSAQPPCYWNVSTLAGRPTTGFTNGVGTSASFNGAFGALVLQNGTLLVVDEFNGAIRSITAGGVVSTVRTGFGNPCAIISDGNGTFYVSESASPSRVSAMFLSGATAPFVGSAAVGAANGIGTNAQFTGPVQLAFNQSTASILLADFGTNTLRAINTATRAVTTAAGTGASGSSDGPAAVATFSNPYGLAVNASGAVFIADNANNNIRLLQGGMVSTYAGGGAAIEGPRAAVQVTAPRYLALDALGNLLVPSDNRLRSISPNGEVRTLVGSGAGAVVDGFGTAASLSAPWGVALAPSGTMFVTDNAGTYVRQLTCVPCPATFYCATGVPLLCPAGSACPLSTITPQQCQRGTAAAAGSSVCSACAAGTFAPAPGAAACQQCPSGHYCPPGTAVWANLNCGRGKYCPAGSAAPLPCPYQVPPVGGWGDLGVQGPAFLVETAACINHCFWNFSSGDGLLSRC